MLHGRGVHHRGQQLAIYVCLAQQGDRAGGGAVAQNPTSGGSLRRQPVMQGPSMGVDIPLKAGEGGRITNAGASVFREQRQDHVVRAAALPRRDQQHGATIEVELP
ncbi:MAG TPA: hypothetical protein VN714_08580, partial [Trebonia sp.]|nr:hypothetical protein [Trebonia sp.]